jgi:hypothetical protein
MSVRASSRKGAAVSTAALTAALAIGGVALAGSASAAGTGGVDLAPADGQSAFHVPLRYGEHATVRFVLRNLRGRPVSAEVYAASATPDGGSYSIGGVSSAPWLSLPATSVQLGAHASRTMSFTVRRETPSSAPTSYGAIVLQVAHGTIIERAATLVYLQRRGADMVQRILLPALAAALLIAAIGVGLVRLQPIRRGGR